MAAHRRHDITDEVWERLRRICLGERASKAGRPTTTGGLSTPCAGFCAPGRLGAICPRTMGTGRTPIVASAGGGTGAYGLDCWIP